MAMSAPGHSLNLNVMMQSLSGLFRSQCPLPVVTSVTASRYSLCRSLVVEGVLVCKVLPIIITNYVIWQLLIPFMNILSGNIIF